MKANPQIEVIWKELIDSASPAVPLQIHEIESGYYAVVCATGSCETDEHLLQDLIPDIERTRAVYLNQAFQFGANAAAALRQWLGPASRALDRGTVRAIAVVDIHTFSQRLVENFKARGWQSNVSPSRIEARLGPFIETFNFPRIIVQMAFGPDNMQAAIEDLTSKLTARFKRDRSCFLCSEQTVRRYRPSALGHFFAITGGDSGFSPPWSSKYLGGSSSPGAGRSFAKAADGIEGVSGARYRNGFGSRWKRQNAGSYGSHLSGISGEGEWSRAQPPDICIKRHGRRVAGWSPGQRDRGFRRRIQEQ